MVLEKPKLLFHNLGGLEGNSKYKKLKNSRSSSKRNLTLKWDEKIADLDLLLSSVPKQLTQPTQLDFTKAMDFQVQLACANKKWCMDEISFLKCRLSESIFNAICWLNDTD